MRASGDWPKLKAKAASTRHLAEYALNLATRFARLDSPNDAVKLHDELSIGACQLLVEFYQLLSRESTILSGSARARIPELGEQLCGIYTRLATNAFNRGLRLWKLAPKFHLFLHLCAQCVVFGNARLWWTYGDEDMVKHLIAIAETVHPATLASSVLSKWLWVVFDQLLYNPDDFE